jgi:hypothetical protein
MNTGELWQMGLKHVPNFIGVYPLDKIPKIIAPANLIINTHTHNLSGEHWIAVSYRTGGIVYAFDPFGFYYPKILQNYLYRLSPLRFVKYNTIQLQDWDEHTCGLYCIAWLIAINSDQTNQ